MSARFPSIARGVARRGIKVLFTTPSLFLPSMLFPLFFLAAFAGGLAQVGKVPNFDFANGYTSFVYGFVTLQASAFAGVFTGFGIARDFESGFARRMLLAAPNRKGLVAGYALVALTRAAFSLTVLTTAAIIGGLDFTGTVADALALAGLCLLVNQTALLWSSGVAMRLKTLQAGPLMQIPVLLSLFLTPVYVPLALLTGWMHSVAGVNPLTPIVESGRNLIAGSTGHALAAYGIAVALVVLFSVWSLLGLRRAERGV